MNDLFEAFVGQSMKAALAPLAVDLQHTGHYTLEGEGRGLFGVQPDIVIDTKWKMINPHESTLSVSQPDI